MTIFIKDVIKYREILRAQIVSDLRLSTAGTRLGALWWILDPIFMMAVYYFVVHILFEKGGDNYHIFLLAALVPWQWFSRSLISAVASLNKSGAILSEVAIPLYLPILSPILTNLVYMIAGIVVLIIFSGSWPGLYLLAVIPILLVQATFTFSLSIIFSVLNVYVRDTQRILGFALRAWWFLSPILYDASLVLDSKEIPDVAKIIFQLNPFVPLLQGYRDIFLEGRCPETLPLIILMLSSLIMLKFGLWLIRNRNNEICKTVSM